MQCIIKKPAKYRKLLHKNFGRLLKKCIFVLRYAMKQTTLKTKQNEKLSRFI